MYTVSCGLVALNEYCGIMLFSVMWILYCVLMFVALAISVTNSLQANSRQKRYLIFTTDTQWGVFATVSIPLHPETTVSVAWFFEANYYAVDNATYFEPLLGDIPISRDRKKRSVNGHKGLTRSYTYLIIESLLERHGYHGRPCLLRAICDAATSQFPHSGLLGDLLHLILTPSTSISEDSIEDCFYEAEYHGLDNNCDHYNYNCPDDPLQRISVRVEDFI